MACNAPEFCLSNGKDTPAIVHTIVSQSTHTCQYIIADPSSRHCIVIDPVRDFCADRAAISTSSADAIVELVKKHDYIVDHILETNASIAKPLTASWYLRMQFSDMQGWPPQLYSDGTVSAMHSMWQRRYGSTVNFTTNIGQSLPDGECLKVGRMRVHCLHLSSFAASHCRGFLIGHNLFGAHTIAVLPQDHSLNISLTVPADAETYTNIWTSMRRVLSLPEDTLVHPTSVSPNSSKDESLTTTIRQCRLTNSYVDLSAPEFAIRWEGKRQAMRQYERQSDTKGHRRGKRGRDISIRK